MTAERRKVEKEKGNDMEQSPGSDLNQFIIAEF